jgi:hypothetical protein
MAEHIWYNDFTIGGDMKKNAISLILLLITIVLTMLSCSSPALNKLKDIVINEVVSSNSKSLTDAELDSPDWIEFYNPTDSKIDLVGYTLKIVKGANTNSFTFGEYEAMAGSYNVFCASTNPQQSSKYVNIGFNLPKDGFSLFLFTC